MCQYFTEYYAKKYNFLNRGVINKTRITELHFFTINYKSGGYYDVYKNKNYY